MCTILCFEGVLCVGSFGGHVTPHTRHKYGGVCTILCFEGAVCVGSLGGHVTPHTRHKYGGVCTILCFEGVLCVGSFGNHVTPHTRHKYGGVCTMFVRCVMRGLYWESRDPPRVCCSLITRFVVCMCMFVYCFMIYDPWCLLLLHCVRVRNI